MLLEDIFINSTSVNLILFFENVYKVEPGQVICFSCKRREASERVTSWKYWDIAQVHQAKAADKVNSYEQAKEELTAILKDAVAKRMIADVPLGTFLSGGYDSSLVTALAQSLSNEPVKTYSIGFHEENYNEARYAKEVAKHLGTNHTELYVDEKAMFHMLDDIAKYYDEPFADSSQIPPCWCHNLHLRTLRLCYPGMVEMSSSVDIMSMIM